MYCARARTGRPDARKAMPLPPGRGVHPKPRNNEPYRPRTDPPGPQSQRIHAETRRIHTPGERVRIEPMNNLRISLIQGETRWHDPAGNRDYYGELVSPLRG